MIERRRLLGGLGLGALGLLGGGCEAIAFLDRMRPDRRRVGSPLIASPIWPPLLIDVVTDLVVFEKKQVSSTENFDWGLADDRDELTERVAAQVRQGVDLLLPIGTPAIQAAAAASSTVPIVAVQLGDAPDASAVERLVRPGGNLSAVVSSATGLTERRLELLRRARPDARRAGLLWHPDSTWPGDTPAQLSAAARRLGLELLTFELNTPSELPRVIDAAGRAELAGLLLLPEWLTSRVYLRLTELAASANLPLIAPYRRCASLGALLSYGPNLSLIGRAAAGLIGKVLDGAAPGGLPIRRVDEVDLVVNSAVARQLGLSLPSELVREAIDEGRE
jgi:ABC-type uncharacterized transport system substrate-binding protein